MLKNLNEIQEVTHGGKRTGAGRPLDALKHRFQRILEEANAYDKLKQILLTTKDEEVFMKALQIALDRGYGKPKESVEVNAQINIVEAVLMARSQRGLN